MTSTTSSAVGWLGSELSRRRVFRVAAVYAVIAFVMAQVADRGRGSR